MWTQSLGQARVSPRTGLCMEAWNQTEIIEAIAFVAQLLALSAPLEVSHWLEVSFAKQNGRVLSKAGDVE